MAYGLTKSATFNGTNQYLTYSTSSGSIRVTNNFTFEAWVRITDVDTSIDDMIFSAWGQTTPANCAYYLYTPYIGGTYYIHLQGASGSSEGNARVSWTPSNDTWYHIAVTFASGTVKFYVNGIQQGADQTMSNGITSINAANASSTGALGAYFDGSGSGDWFKGQISLARIWTQVQSQATIAANMCTFFGSAQTGMAAEWSLDNVLTDSSGNGYTLTNHNTVTFATNTPSVCATVPQNSNFLLYMA